MDPLLAAQAPCVTAKETGEDWVGDNGGARSAPSVKANFHAIQQEYPNAKVQTSTFDAFLPALKRANASLPVISSEGESGNLAPRIIDSVRLVYKYTHARAHVMSPLSTLACVPNIKVCVCYWATSGRYMDSRHAERPVQDQSYASDDESKEFVHC